MVNSVLQKVMLLSLITNVYDKHPDIPLMVSCSTVVCGVTVNSFKITSLQRKIVRMGAFYRRMIDMWNIPKKTEKQHLMEHKSFINIVSFLNCLSLIAGISWWLLLPPAVSVYEKYVTGNTTWIAPYNITNIAIMQTTPGYEILTIIYYSITAMCVIGGCGFDSYYLESCFYLSGHFRIIRQRFQAVHFTVPGNSGEVNNKFKKEVSSIIDYHNEILNACAILQDLVRSAILPFVLFDSIVICTCVYTLMVVNSLIVTIAFVGISSAAVGQIFILTYSGEVLTGRSQELLEGIYNSEWYLASPEQRKLMIVCMMRSRKGFTFQMGIFQLALTTFSAIVQTAGSYIALLKTISPT
ncbi:odorant receptor 82a-like [Lutzomyia longipalpis]|uniref:odorant receptor 82a-like n=1 Tax=Lutzomyia longipalpis TaxID=7200 RepID=UPI0024842AF8|nr:odorant receptor 82a-like [Lutzomyia longipalpis]